MILFHAFCQKDYQGAVQFFERCLELSGKPDGHRCVLVSPAGMPEESVAKVVSAARKAFQTVLRVTPGTADETPWPSPCNTLWKAAAHYAATQGQPWLWTEPDCIPLCAGWLERIEQEYALGKKPFMGAMYEHPKPHINGCCVYPAKVSSYAPALLITQTLPWDLVEAARVLKQAHVTPLIQRSLADPKTNQAHTFPDEASLEVIDARAVLFHGCKDGTLCDRFSGRPAGSGKGQ